MIPDWSERDVEDSAYPHRSHRAVEQQYCMECNEPLSQDEVECERNDGICDVCLGNSEVIALCDYCGSKITALDELFIVNLDVFCSETCSLIHLKKDVLDCVGF